MYDLSTVLPFIFRKTYFYMLGTVVYTNSNIGYSHTHKTYHLTVIYFILYFPLICFIFNVGALQSFIKMEASLRTVWESARLEAQEFVQKCSKTVAISVALS